MTLNVVRVSTHLSVTVISCFTGFQDLLLKRLFCFKILLFFQVSPDFVCFYPEKKAPEFLPEPDFIGAFFNLIIPFHYPNKTIAKSNVPYEITANRNTLKAIHSKLSFDIFIFSILSFFTIKI